MLSDLFSSLLDYAKQIIAAVVSLLSAIGYGVYRYIEASHVAPSGGNATNHTYVNPALTLEQINASYHNSTQTSDDGSSGASPAPARMLLQDGTTPLTLEAETGRKVHCYNGPLGACYNFQVTDESQFTMSGLVDWCAQWPENTKLPKLALENIFAVGTGDRIVGEGACGEAAYHCSIGKYGSCYDFTSADYGVMDWNAFGYGGKPKLHNDFEGFMAFCQGWEPNKHLNITTEKGLLGQTIGGRGKCPKQTGEMYCYYGTDGACLNLDSRTDYPVAGLWDKAKSPLLTADLAGFSRFCAAMKPNHFAGHNFQAIASVKHEYSGQPLVGLGKCAPWGCVPCRCDGSSGNFRDCSVVRSEGGKYVQCYNPISTGNKIIPLPDADTANKCPKEELVVADASTRYCRNWSLKSTYQRSYLNDCEDKCASQPGCNAFELDTPSPDTFPEHECNIYVACNISGIDETRDNQEKPMFMYTATPKYRAQQCMSCSCTVVWELPDGKGGKKKFGKDCTIEDRVGTQGPTTCYHTATTNGALALRPTPAGAPADQCALPGGCVPCACKTKNAELDGGYGGCVTGTPAKIRSSGLPYGPFTCYDPRTTGWRHKFRSHDVSCPQPASS